MDVFQNQPATACCALSAVGQLAITVPLNESKYVTYCSWCHQPESCRQSLHDVNQNDVTINPHDAIIVSHICELLRQPLGLAACSHELLTRRAYKWTKPLFLSYSTTAQSNILQKKTITCGIHVISILIHARDEIMSCLTRTLTLCHLYSLTSAT